MYVMVTLLKKTDVFMLYYSLAAKPKYLNQDTLFRLSERFP